MTYPFGKTVIVTPQTVDNYGNRTPGSPVSVDDCAVWYTPGVETVGGQDTVIYDASVVAPAGTVVHATDRVTVGAATFEVVSEPIEWDTVFTQTRFVQVLLRRVVG